MTEQSLLVSTWCSCGHVTWSQRMLMPLPHCSTKQLIIRTASSLSSLQDTGFLPCQSLLGVIWSQHVLPTYCRYVTMCCWPVFLETTMFHNSIYTFNSNSAQQQIHSSLKEKIRFFLRDSIWWAVSTHYIPGKPQSHILLVFLKYGQNKCEPLKYWSQKLIQIPIVY